jgi:hypothetical protein
MEMMKLKGCGKWELYKIEGIFIFIPFLSLSGFQSMACIRCGLASRREEEEEGKDDDDPMTGKDEKGKNGKLPPIREED